MASVNFNMSNNSGFGDVNNCSSLDSSVVSSPTVNSICRNSFYKLTNVLLLLFLVFGSSVVSFGAEGQQIKMESKPFLVPPQKKELIDNINEPKEDGPVYIAPRDIYLRVPSIINKISMLFLTKVIQVNVGDIKDEVYDEDWFVFLSLLGLHEHSGKYGNGNADMLLVGFYSISNMSAHSLYRGIFSTKPFSSKYDFIGCNWYLGVGNVSYVGGLFNFSLVCKPTLLTFLQDKEVTIHIIDIKPFNFILGCVFYTWLTWYTECKKLYIRPQWIVGFGTVEIKVAKYYNISLNVGSWIVDLITFMKYTKKANEKGLDDNPEFNQTTTDA